jgi:phosphoribosylformylglycinamidine (FGAM) synthase-like enzyme
MAISKSKRRYMISLRPEVVDRFQTLAKELRMPANTMSEACENAIKTASDIFQMQKDNGIIELSDLYKVLGQQMELIETDQKGKDNGGQKRN